MPTEQSTKAGQKPKPDADRRQPSQPAESAPTEEETTDIAALRDELEEAKRQATDNMDKYIRARAELDNVKKRGQRDLENARKYALEGFVKELLEVRDSLELGLAHAQGDDNDAQELKQGGELTLRKLSQVMEKFNIVQLDPKGEPFDPALHEAMTITPTDEVAPNHIAIVAQKGYQLHDRLIRPARVVVAQAPPQEQSPDAGA